MSTLNFPLRITIAVCTRERPKMLRRLLGSIVEMDKAENVELNVVIVENDSASKSKSIIREFESKLRISYSLETKLGLVFARNAAIESSLNTEAEWIAFVDDDEWIDANWLTEMINASKKFPNNDAFAGPIDRIPPDTATKWFPSDQTARGKTGVHAWNVGTGNIMFRRSVYALDGAAMRFDERFNFSGGEDTFLFLSMKRKGIPIIWVQEALCSEDVLPERATLSFRFRRTIHYMHNFGVINQVFLGPVLGRIKNLTLGFKMLFHFVSYLIVGASICLVNRKVGQDYIGVSIQRFARAVGTTMAVFKPLQSVYNEVDGN